MGQQGLQFFGFRTSMPGEQVEKYVRSSRGTWSCSEPAGEERRCSGTVPYPGFEQPIALQVTTLKGVSAVIVLTTRVLGNVAETWVSALRQSYGQPELEEAPGKHRRWTWRKGDQTIAVTERVNAARRLETTVTLADAALTGTAPPAPPQKPGSFR
jgi:hypothetical protein